MNSKNKLSDTEFSEMMRYLHRYVETSMDQWEQWTFDSSLGKTYVRISLKPDGPEKSYDDLNECLK